jgi:hypothetical protein
MTDFRFPERWLNDRRFKRLPGDLLAAYVCAGTWSVANRTDGVILRADLDDIPRLTPVLADALTLASVFDALADGWLMTDYADTQTMRADLEHAASMRRAAAESKRRRRAHKNGNHSLCSPDCEPVRPDVPWTPPMSPWTQLGQDRPGQDRHQYMQ